MLELIVLGEIPGTPIIITFSGILAVVSLLFGASMARFVKKHKSVNIPKVEEVTL